jgi:hypothetical protein
MAKKKEDVEPLGGSKDIAKRVEAGQDVNADLDAGLDAEDTESKSGMAVALRLSGASYTDIARTAGYSSAYRARQAVERVLASSADSPEERDQMRVLTSRRLNRLLQSVMGKAVDPKDPQHLAYNARALALVDREARLWGVDAPTQVQISANDEQIENYVKNMSLLAAASTEADEAEILDADVVEADI